VCPGTPEPGRGTAQIIVTVGPAHENPAEEILFGNKYFERMTGYSKTEALGETPKMLQDQQTSEHV
jgi:PAS domain-containing protein